MASPSRVAGVGFFVLLAIALFAVAIFMIGDRRMAFTRRFIVYTEFAKVTGLQPGAMVRVAGARAGEVTDIVPPAQPAGKFRVRLQVTEDLHQLVRSDSQASIDSEGLVGGVYLAIASGSASAPPAPPLSTLPSQEPFDVSDLLQQMSSTITLVNTTVVELRGQVEETIGAVGDTVANANTLITDVSGDVKGMTASGARVSADLASLTSSVREGRGTVGRLFTDDAMYRRVAGVVANAEQITTDARAVVTQARETLERARGAEGSVAGLTGSLQQTLNDARDAMAGFAENMDALRHNFLLRGFFNARGYYDLAQISPAEYRAGALSGAGRSPSRVWLTASRIFEMDGSADAPKLSADGRRRLDSAMATYLERVGDGVLMVEGFAQGGARDQQYLASRARASAVREYLIARFHLDPRSTGSMPLGSETTAHPPVEPWDGIALAFYTKSR